MKTALARLSQSVDRLIERLTSTQGPDGTEAELNALADKIDRALGFEPPPPPPPPHAGYQPAAGAGPGVPPSQTGSGTK
jgi:hypothetical protein